jgi:hypothetical protein
MAAPELIIGYQLDGSPLVAACALCIELIAVDSPRPSKPQDAVNASSERSKIHIQKKHPELLRCNR